MVITRTPLRVSLGGGGSDLPSYYSQHGGMVVAAAINKYVYVAVNRAFKNEYILKYSELEEVGSVEEIRHPIMREVLSRHQLGPAIEVASIADIPAGTGLGSSGAFTVGLLRAIYGFKREHVVTQALAEEACAVEIDRLRRSVGKQDQYAAAFGGLICLEFDRDGSVRVSPLRISNATLHDLEERLLLFFTGYSRDADAILADQRSRSEAGDPAMLDNLHSIVRIGAQVKGVLEAGDTAAFAELMNEHWERKRARSRGMSSGAIDRWYERARASGALGGKLVGAGAGGFLMFYASDPRRLRRAMEAEGLMELRFAFDHDGSTVIVRS